MPPVQTAYNLQPKASAGQLGTQKRFDADTRVVETDAGIGFGLVVSEGVAANGIVVGGDEPVGITYRDTTLVSGNADKYLDGQDAAVMHRGDVWVEAAGAVAPGSPVLFNATTGEVGGPVGTRLNNARYMNTAAEGEFVLVRLGSRGVGDETVAPPVNSVAPALSGTEQVGETLTVSNGTWSGTPSFTYQWYADDVAIAGATASTYDLTVAEEGAIVHAVVTATNAGGSASAPSDDTAAIIPAA